jgi:hypothetical protein
MRGFGTRILAIWRAHSTMRCRARIVLHASPGDERGGVEFDDGVVVYVKFCGGCVKWLTQGNVNEDRGLMKLMPLLKNPMCVRVRKEVRQEQSNATTRIGIVSLMVLPRIATSKERGKSAPMNTIGNWKFRLFWVPSSSVWIPDGQLYKASVCSGPQQRRLLPSCGNF